MRFVSGRSRLIVISPPNHWFWFHSVWFAHSRWMKKWIKNVSPTVCLILWTTAVVSNSILVVGFAFFAAGLLPFCAGWQLSNADVIHWQIAKAYRFETNRKKKNGIWIEKWLFVLGDGCCAVFLCDHQSKYQPLFDFCCFCRTFNLYSRLWSYGIFFFSPVQNSREWHLWKLNCTIETAESRMRFYTRHLKTWCWISRMEEQRNRGTYL